MLKSRARCVIVSLCANLQVPLAGLMGLFSCGLVIAQTHVVLVESRLSTRSGLTTSDSTANCVSTDLQNDVSSVFPRVVNQNTTVSLLAPSPDSWTSSASSVYSLSENGPGAIFRVDLDDRIPALNSLCRPSAGHNLSVIVTTDVPLAYNFAGYYQCENPGSAWVDLLAQISGPSGALYRGSRYKVQNSDIDVDMTEINGVGLASGTLGPGTWYILGGMSIEPDSSSIPDLRPVGSMVFTLGPLQSVTQQPQNGVVCSGSDTVVSVGAPSATKVKWEWRPTPLSAWRDVSQGTNTDIDGGSTRFEASRSGLTSITFSHDGNLGLTTGRFDVRAVVAGGFGTVTSNPATIYVHPADIGASGGVPGPDGRHDNNDFVVFIDAFFGSHPAADLGMQGGMLGSDGIFDNNDFVVYVDQFFAGC